MFEGVQDQFHQFLTPASNSTPISSSSSSSHHHHHHQNPLLIPPPPLSFSLLHGCTTSSSSPSPPLFHHVDPYNPVQAHLHHQILHQQHQLQWAQSKQQQQQIEGGGGGVKEERSMVEEHSDLIDSSSSSAAWSHDELLALLRVRSALENWFPEFTWEHVSRKLSELGFKRSPQKCKERFEEESRSYFHTTKNSDVNAMENDVTNKNNYRLFSELEELCHHQQQHQQQQHMDVINVSQGDVILDKQNPQRQEQEHMEEENEQQERVKERSLDENDVADKAEEKEMEDEQMIETQQHRKKDCRHGTNKKKKFEIFKSFCEEIVNKMMCQQEELHNKILQDMMKRDEEKTIREEAWRKQEMERINKEMEGRAKDLAMVSDRQAKIIEFLKKFACDSSVMIDKKDGENGASSSATHSTSSNEGSISNTNKNRSIVRKPRPNKRPRTDNCSDGNDIGKRWPREEVLALINIRCNIDLTNKTGPDDSGQNRSNVSNSSSKNPPLWERISHKMMERRYSRSAKRCKEKWENINKYFRKTKDMNKNRSVDSRTCPYFHQLSHLYNQGRVAGGGSEGGAAMNVDVSDHQGEDATGVQPTMSTAPCDIEF